MTRTAASTAVTGTQSVERALSLLSAFSDERPEFRISELGAMAGLGQSTASRLVSALEGLGYLVQDPRSGLYRLGPKLVTLAGVALNQSPVLHQARQAAQNLAHRLGLGVNIAERHGDEYFYLAHFEGPRAPRNFTLLGRSGPLHATGLGKSLVCDMSREQLQGLLGDTLHAFTPHTVTGVEALADAVREVRLRGYATEVEELAFGRACLAAPIRDRSGAIVAALSVSGPLSVMDLTNEEQTLSLTVIECADHISTALGYHPAAPRPA
ncbi:IclR family transcriptional regulator [Ruania alba]|uniref:Glycerol operon regulatory protein n=1 Tax=Ruania alba TaxID=648782 RepID=A0A1H5N0Y0_9MICO|nr:IclR family transcriptional regulator [Ruania alba]SEE94308.1 DNA-binding transcriptional regulator, IclR family [Ruania alba]